MFNYQWVYTYIYIYIYISGQIIIIHKPEIRPFGDIYIYIYIYQRDDIGKCGFFSERWREAEMVKRGEADHPSISLLDGLRFLRARDLRRIWSRGSRGDPPWFTQKIGGFIQKMDGFTQKMGGFTQKMGGFTQKMGGFTIVYCMFTRG